jgi:hypothetical protein
MVGGYESIDYLVHLLVYKISKSIEIDLSLYYPIKVDIENECLKLNYYMIHIIVQKQKIYL